MRQLIPNAMSQTMLVEEQFQQTASVYNVISIKSGYANYRNNSTTNDSNALINVLENVIIIDPSN